MNKLQIVTRKICELTKDTDCDPIRRVVITMELKSDDEINAIRRRSPIMEAEVLVALGKFTDKREEVALSHLGEFLYIDKSCSADCSCSGWILGKPLLEQSKETIEFLFNTLGCE